MHRLFTKTLFLAGIFCLFGYTPLMATQKIALLSQEDSLNEDNPADDETKFTDEAVLPEEPVFVPLEVFQNERIAARSLPDSFVKQLQGSPDFSYVKEGLKKPTNEATSQNSRAINLGWLAYLPYIAIGLFLLILIGYLVSNKFILFKRKGVSLPEQTHTAALQDIFSINYTEEIRKALAQQNYRLAIRLQYLELLKKLSDRQLIQFMPDKPNIEYLAQLRTSYYYPDFFTATRNYEYSWYGLFPVTESMYQQINHIFLQLKQKLK